MFCATLPRFHAAPVAPPIRPDEERWSVGDQGFKNTADLVAKYQPPLQGADATYSFRTRFPQQQKSLLWDTARGTTIGAAVGAGVTLAGIAALDILGGVFTVMTAGFYGMPGALPLLGPVLIGAGIGAAIGGGTSFSSSRQTEAQGRTQNVSGRLLNQAGTDGNHLMFYPGSNMQQAPVDLNAYANAVAAPEPAAQPAVPRWKDALNGAWQGAALPVSTLVPVAGPFIPTAVLASKGGRADRIPSRGQTLGALAGAALTVGSYAAMASGHWPILLGLTAACAVGGAIAGPVINPHLRRHDAEADVYGAQWWNTAGTNGADAE